VVFLVGKGTWPFISALRDKNFVSWRSFFVRRFEVVRKMISRLAKPHTVR